jgi:hypothetical protein
MLFLILGSSCLSICYFIILAAPVVKAFDAVDEPALCLTLYLCKSVVFEESTSEQCVIKVTSSTNLICWCFQAFLSKPV